MEQTTTPLTYKSATPNNLERWALKHPPFPMEVIPNKVEADPNGMDPHVPGAKLDAGKCKAGVLHDFAFALKAVADVGTMGALKYSRGGWQSVPDAEERYFDALWRHMLASRHEELDPDSGLPHLAHLAWNVLAVLEIQGRSKLP